MYKCLNCGSVFDEPIAIYEREPYGNSYAEYHSDDICPYCKGDIDTAEKCEICGEYYAESDIYNGVCIECIKIDCEKLSTLFDYAESITPENKINRFVTAMFDGQSSKLNDFLKLTLQYCDDFDKKMFFNKKQKFIEEHAADISQWLGDRDV